MINLGIFFSFVKFRNRNPGTARDAMHSPAPSERTNRMHLSTTPRWNGSPSHVLRRRGGAARRKASNAGGTGAVQTAANNRQSKETESSIQSTVAGACTAHPCSPAAKPCRDSTSCEKQPAAAKANQEGAGVVVELVASALPEPLSLDPSKDVELFSPPCPSLVEPFTAAFGSVAGDELMSVEVELSKGAVMLEVVVAETEEDDEEEEEEDEDEEEEEEDEEDEEEELVLVVSVVEVYVEEVVEEVSLLEVVLVEVEELVLLELLELLVLELELV